MSENPDNPENNSKTSFQLNPWGDDLVADEDYIRLCEEFGINLIQDLEIPYSAFEKNRFLRRKIIYGHRDFGLILKAIRDEKPWAILSGIKPSGHFHLGTLTTASEMVEFQKMGGTIYYAIADLESYADNGTSLDIAYKYAVDNLADILTLGLNPKSYVYLQSREQISKDMVYMAGRHVTNNMMKAIYGDRDFALYMAALVQVGDILLPQLKDGPMPTLVPVGIDQDPHLRLVRDLTRHFKYTKKKKQKTKKVTPKPLFKPAATYHKLLPGLDDVTKKMSKSRPNSYFNLGDDPLEIEKKLKRAFTGGRGNKEDQKKLGGIPEKCMIYKLLQIHFQPDDKKLQDRYLRCKNGMLCGTCKKEAIQIIMDFIKEHNEKKEEMIPIAKEMLSREPKTSNF
ncbi:MAG: tryptophan--tRNA ligase [Promethearchaeota archaeon]